MPSIAGCLERRWPRSSGSPCFDQALAKKAKGNRGCGALAYIRSSGQEGRLAGGVVTRPARKRSRPEARGALRGVRGGFESKGLHGYYKPEHFSPSRQLAAQKNSRVAQERDEEKRGLWKWLASRLDPRQLISIDESGFHTSMTRLRARAPKGERAYGKGPSQPWQEHHADRLDQPRRSNRLGDYHRGCNGRRGFLGLCRALSGPHARRRAGGGARRAWSAQATEGEGAHRGQRRRPFVRAFLLAGPQSHR
jgi:hypothetical protein